MVIVDQQRAHQRVLYEQTNMTVQQASSQQLLFPLVFFFSNRNGAYRRVETLLCGFVLKTLVNHVVISGTP
jgi:DNA mismatch repair protein MutL